MEAEWPWGRQVDGSCHQSSRHPWEASASSPFAHKGLRLLLRMGLRPHRQEMELLEGETCPLSSAAPELSLSWDMPQAALCAYYLLNAHGSLPTWCVTVHLQSPSVRALRLPHEMQSLYFSILASFPRFGHFENSQAGDTLSIFTVFQLWV